MDESKLAELMAGIGRIEAELSSLRATAMDLGAEPIAVPALAGAVAAAPKVTPPAPVAVGMHRSGIAGPIGDLVARFFEAGLLEDGETKWDRLASLSHSDALVGPRSLEYLKAFNWRQFSKNASSYLKAGDVDSFTVDRADPLETLNVDKVKLFLKGATGRHPAPIHLAKDPENGGVWRVVQVAL